MSGFEALFVFIVVLAIGISTGIWLSVRFQMKNVSDYWAKLHQLLVYLDGDGQRLGSTLDNNDSATSSGTGGRKKKAKSNIDN